MKRYLILILGILLIPINIFAHAQLEDGWHTVKNTKKTSDCNYNYVWGYYKNGVEKVRRCRLVTAHRGWGDAPENSLDAIKMVKEKGYYGYETDVRFTKDNIPILMHDATINRVGRNKGKINSELTNKIYVKNLTLAELKEKYVFPITRTGKVLTEYKDNKITTFEEALKYSKENGLYMVIELKAGTEEQIAILVNIVKKYNMDNKVRWISFQHLLLSYVKLADDDEQLTLLCRTGPLCSKDSTEICTPADNSYCGTEEERSKYHQELDTSNNFVYMKGDKSYDSRGRGTSNTANLPELESEYPKDKYKLSVIPKGKITLSSSEVSIKVNNKKTINYTYDGDGKVKCQSSDKKSITCKVDTSKRQIVIEGIKANNSGKVSVYATQGTEYSATVDYNITVKVKESNETTLIGDVDGNGKVGTSDYVLIRKYLLKISNLTNEELKRADVNSDGKVNPSDYIVIRKILLGVN